MFFWREVNGVRVFRFIKKIATRMWRKSKERKFCLPLGEQNFLVGIKKYRMYFLFLPRAGNYRKVENLHDS